MADEKENARAEGSGAGREGVMQCGEQEAHNGNDARLTVTGTPLNDAALTQYRSARLDLIPLKSRDKAPADGGWRTREYDYLTTVNRARKSGMNLGVRLPADVVVLDVDPRRFPEGRDPLKELAAAVGLNLTAVPHVVTGNLQSPGHHYYFRKPAAADLRDSLDAYPGVEFKSLGRQVVAAGSVHPTGGTYSWAAESPPLHLMPDLPPKALELARRPERKKATGAGEITPEQLAKSLKALDPSDFSEHDQWFELMAACHHATDGEGRQEFIEWSISDPEYADDEWIIGNRWDSLHANRPDSITIATLCMRLHEAGADIAPPDPEDEFEVWDEPVVAQDAATRWRFRTIEEVEALPPPQWLIPGVLTEMSLAAIYGAPESGKSFLAVDMAMCVAGGIPWHMRPVMVGGVLYIAAEGARGLAKRVRAWKQVRGATDLPFEFRLFDAEINLAAEQDAMFRSFLAAAVAELAPLKLIVIDTLNQTAAGADENSSKDIGRYVNSMKRLRDQTGATVVVVHHTGKDSSKGMRGSNALLGAMDTTVLVDRKDHEPRITVSVEKQKDSEREGAMRFNLERVVLPGEADVMGKPPSSLVLKPLLMEDAASDFLPMSDPVVDLACELAASTGTVPNKQLTEELVARQGMSEATARRKIKESIGEGREKAARGADGTVVWREKDGLNPNGPMTIRVARVSAVVSSAVAEVRAPLARP